MIKDERFEYVMIVSERLKFDALGEKLINSVFKEPVTYITEIHDIRRKHLTYEIEDIGLYYKYIDMVLKLLDIYKYFHGSAEVKTSDFCVPISVSGGKLQYFSHYRYKNLDLIAATIMAAYYPRTKKFHIFFESPRAAIKYYYYIYSNYQKTIKVVNKIICDKFVR